MNCFYDGLDDDDRVFIGVGDILDWMFPDGMEDDYWQDW